MNVYLFTYSWWIYSSQEQNQWIRAPCFTLPKNNILPRKLDNMSMENHHFKCRRYILKCLVFHWHVSFWGAAPKNTQTRNPSRIWWPCDRPSTSCPLSLVQWSLLLSNALDAAVEHVQWSMITYPPWKWMVKRRSGFLLGGSFFGPIFRGKLAVGFKEGSALNCDARMSKLRPAWGVIYPPPSTNSSPLWKMVVSASSQKRSVKSLGGV